MTDDTLDHLTRDVRRIAVTGTPTPRDTRTLADALGMALEALAEAMRGLRETRHLVDALVGGVRVEGPVTYTYRGLDDGMYTAKRAGAVTHTVTQHEPCPLAGTEGHECRWQLGVRACVGESKLPYAVPIDGSTPACLYETPRGLKTAREIVDAQIQERDKLRAEVAEYKEHVREAYEERDALKAALRSACELLDPHARSDADRARIAELRRLL